MSQVILSPERYNPNRLSSNLIGQEITDFANLSKQSQHPKKMNPSEALIVLDTGDAKDGYLNNKSPTVPTAIKSNKKVLKAGDVIVSRLRPYLRQVGYADAALFSRNIPVVCSTEFYVLRPRLNLDIAFLVPFLLTEPVQALFAASQEGGHHPRFPTDVLLSLQIPEPLVAEAQNIANQIHRHIAQIRSGENGVKQLISRSQQLLNDDSIGRKKPLCASGFSQSSRS